MVVELGVLH